MNLETCIESCLQSVKNMSAARLYNNYVVPYRVRRRAKTTEDLTKEVFQAKKLINQNIVHLFSLALKNLIGVGGKASSVGIEGLLNQHATGEKKRDRESRRSLVMRRQKGRRTTGSLKSLRTADAVLTQGREEEGNEEVLVTSENFNGPPGTWIECTRCKKWRFEPEVRDPSEIAENWRCCLQKKLAHLQPSVEVEEAACAEPEDATAKFHDQSYLFNEFTAGSIVLAKMPGFPWWPAMVDLDASGKYARFDPETHIATHYNVVFLDPCKSTTKLLPASSLCKFTQADKADILRKAGRHLKKLTAAFIEAEEALKVSIEDRVGVFGYPHVSSSFTTKNMASPQKNRPLKQVAFRQVTLSECRERCKFQRTQHNTSQNKVKEHVISETKQNVVCETGIETETVSTAGVNIDELMTAVLFETEDWSSERLYRTFISHPCYPISHKARTEYTPNAEFAAEAIINSPASPVLTKSGPSKRNEGLPVEDDLGASSQLPESDFSTSPLLDFIPDDSIRSPQHLLQTNSLVTQSKWTFAQPAVSAPGPLNLLGVLKTQATAKAELIQAIGQFITSIPFHLQLSVAKPQSQGR
uniref:Zinc finger CW-type PWWP domain protein 1 n=2 Tax=Schistocephalus solidus TaxID=70667 RepID=A0A0X3PWQ0_SCHSO